MKNVKLGLLFCSVAVWYIYILLSYTYHCSLRLAVLQSERVFCSLKSLYRVQTADCNRIYVRRGETVTIKKGKNKRSMLTEPVLKSPRGKEAL